ncbi:MAG: phosphoenolpyruvate--protein phosphotransferase [Spirochaetales bacterium]|nr:MAG: phosphoenolpyruvate--protein phosphotransferase [Spirochaetales bacterium]
MTGIVIVSHSRLLAEKIAYLASSMVPDVEVPIAFAGGVLGENDKLGTDPTDIMSAVESVFGPDGVIIFVDMGSAVLSAEMALELMGANVSDSAVISSAPIVEGAVTASVQSASGASLNEIEQEVQLSLNGKRQQLGFNVSEEPSEENELDLNVVSKKRVFSIDIENGLHARPAAKMVRAVGAYPCDVTVSNLSKVKGPVSARSLNQLSTLEVSKGNEILVVATGEGAAEVLQAIAKLVQTNFGEATNQELKPVRKLPCGTVSLSEGIAVGRAWLINADSLDVPERYITEEEIKNETLRFQTSLEVVRQNILSRINTLSGDFQSPESEIFEAHLVLLEDPDLVEETIHRIVTLKFSAESAWSEAVSQVVKRYENLEDAYLQVRAIDVLDIGVQVLTALGVSISHEIPDFEEPIIVVARELTPSQTVGLKLDSICGIITEKGGPTSHTAILSRARGIPAVGGYVDISLIATGDMLALDGFSGTVYHNPDEDTVNILMKKKEEWLNKQKLLRLAAEQPAVTADGIAVPVLANIASSADAVIANKNGSEGIGLLRTEGLLLNRETVPSLEEQMIYFKRIFAESSGTVTVRTFDVGGDKRIPFLNLDKEDNPFLGVRGIRLYETNRELFETHLEAVLRGAVGYDVNIMFPMVAKLEEFIMAQRRVEEVHLRLLKSNVEHKWPVDLGVMIETPASVLVADDLAGLAAFFSIGTNDLTQYVLAAERGSHQLVGFLDSLEPSVLRAVKTIADIGAEHNIPVSVCGELGAQIEAVPLLIGLGITKISANGTSIPAIKEVIRRTHKKRLQSISADIIKCAKSAGEVKERLHELLNV